MAVDTSTKMRELVDMAARYWAGEAEVVRAYFSRPHTKEQDIRWLKLQCYKEINGSGLVGPDGLIEGPIKRLAEAFPKVDREIDRHEFEEMIEGLYDEFKHYCLLADILDDLSGQKTNPHDLPQYPEDRKLTEMRWKCQETAGELGRFAVTFTEGGGCGIFLAGSQISGGELEQRIAAACKRIYDDEAGHMMAGVHGLERVAKTEEEWEKVKKMVREISLQRVRMRNEQFGFPLSQARLREIDEGKIEPLPLPKAR